MKEGVSAEMSEPMGADLKLIDIRVTKLRFGADAVKDAPQSVSAQFSPEAVCKKRARVFLDFMLKVVVKRLCGDIPQKYVSFFPPFTFHIAQYYAILGWDIMAIIQ